MAQATARPMSGEAAAVAAVVPGAPAVPGPSRRPYRPIC